ncbi:MAG TPA: 16S rRNA (guanine(527)-N(7))-methyltransferase RsmG [Erysipelotrichaceae bacterium]|nr:16S rRNA (guanine(527)-N(7))-methyltransferase RsmG [Erysipelotrichaceae bacterium]
MNKSSFIEELEKRSIRCSESQLAKLWDFMYHVLKTNEQFNLTAIKDEETFVEKMIFDSALLLLDNRLENQDILDIGSGAGFPSVVLAILSPNSRVYALDSTTKKVEFIKLYAEKNNLENLTVINERAEDYAKTHREQFSFVTARAVASLRILIELAVPLLKVGGSFIAMKGLGFEKEVNESIDAFKELNCKIDYIYEDVLPQSKESRSLIFIKKTRKTSKKYPRTFSEIKNRPL